MEVVKTTKNGVSVITEKSLKIVKLLADGFTVKEVAEKIDMNTRTLEATLIKLREALECKSTLHLVATFLREKLIN